MLRQGRPAEHADTHRTPRSGRPAAGPLRPPLQRQHQQPSGGEPRPFDRLPPRRHRLDGADAGDDRPVRHRRQGQKADQAPVADDVAGDRGPGLEPAEDRA